MTVVRLADADDRHRFGGKAYELGAAVRADLPVPAGLAISHEFLDDLVDGTVAESTIVDQIQELDGPYVVRSSGVGEDSETASFAGQHRTELNIRDAMGVIEALQRVHESARTEAVQEYRAQLGLDSTPHMGAVVQTMVDADASGVLFTRNPVTGSDEYVIEAAWGLGEAVVDSLVTPDTYRIDPSGRVIDRRVGTQDIRVVPASGGGTSTVEVPTEKRAERCLTDDDLEALHRLADYCDSFRSGGHDIEWAIADEQIFLLQRRDITTQG